MQFNERFALMKKLSYEGLAGAWFQLRRAGSDCLASPGSLEELGVVIDGLVCCLWIMRERGVSLSMRAHPCALYQDVVITMGILDVLCDAYQAGKRQNKLAYRKKRTSLRRKAYRARHA